MYSFYIVNGRTRRKEYTNFNILSDCTSIPKCNQSFRLIRRKRRRALGGFGRSCFIAPATGVQRLLLWGSPTSPTAAPARPRADRSLGHLCRERLDHSAHPRCPRFPTKLLSHNVAQVNSMLYSTFPPAPFFLGLPRLPVPE